MTEEKAVQRNIWDDGDEPDPPREYIQLEDLISFEGFEWAEWLKGEKEVLQPQLERFGYTDIQWKPGETDSYGPLSRVCKAKNSNGSAVWFIYG